MRRNYIFYDLLVEGEIMLFRKSEKKDVKNIMEIINEAKEYFRENEIDQWQNGYPNEESIFEDIAEGENYVLCDEKGDILASCAISFREEKNYLVIERGEWKSKNPYAVVHRVAVRNSLKGKGLSGILMKEAEKMCSEKNIKSIRIDTHEDNKSMQKLILKCGFEYCGIIYVADGTERFAYEKIL